MSGRRLLRAETAMQGTGKLIITILAIKDLTVFPEQDVDEKIHALDRLAEELLCGSAFCP